MEWWLAPPASLALAGRVLDGSSVDTHVHLAGAVPPVCTWVAFMTADVSANLVRAVFKGETGEPHGDVWERALAEARWLRYGLARALTVSGCAAFPRLPAPDHPAWLDTHASASGSPFDVLTPSSTQDDRATARARASWVARVCLAADTNGHTHSYRDPLASVALAGSSHTFLDGEARLLTHAAQCLRYRPDSGPLASALLRYLRIRNAFHALFVLDDGGPGLARFQRALHRHAGLARRRPHGRRSQRVRRELLGFERARARWAVESQVATAYPEDHGALVRASGDSGGHGPRRSVEWRISLDSGSGCLRRLRALMSGWADALEQAARRRSDGLDDPPTGARPERVPAWQFGFVVHLKRGKNHVLAAAGAERDARALDALLRGHPELRRFIVGVDVAGAERDTPPRCYIAAFRRLRVLQEQFRPRLHEPQIQLGFTCHAGEDAGDLLTGLRYVDEAATFLLPAQGGGRLGHALALAEDPAHYALRPRRPSATRSTALLDLVWAFGRAREAQLGCESVFFEGARALLGEIRQGFSARDAADTVEDGWQAMQQGCSRQGGMLPALDEASILGCMHVALDEYPPTGPEFAAGHEQELRTLQVWLRQALARQGVTIEANPTSNLLVGSYRSFMTLPYDALVDADLRLSINTDDPGVFGTTLPAEFERMQRALEQRGLTRRQASLWLTERLRDAQDTTFLRAQTPFGAELLRTLRDPRLLVARAPDIGGQ